MIRFQALTPAVCRQPFPGRLRIAITQVLLISAVFTAYVFYSLPLAADQASRPNIVLILADDMGYGDVQALNPESTLATPNLDRLASAGMRFTDAHSPSAVCTPTRYGLLTGRYCWRSKLKRGVLNGYSPPLIETDRPTVATFLASQGYTTAIVGKWHLGLGWTKSDDDSIDFTRPVDHGPKQLGFTYSYIIPASLDFPPYVYLRDGVPTDPATVLQNAQRFPPFLREGPRAEDLVMADVLDHLAGRVVEFITEQSSAGKPFFLYFPLTAPHKPVLPHPRFRGQTDLGPYGDFITQVDSTVGSVLDAIEASGITQNTIVIYSSDNGSFMYRLDEPDAVDHVDDEALQAYRSDRHRSNGSFRGTKADIWEGGHHVPFIVRWPGQVAAGESCPATICLTDCFATLADVLGKAPPSNAAPDSFSIGPAIRGESWTRPEPVIHHSAGGMFAVRSGDWKLVLGNGSGGRQAPAGKPFERPYALFNLANDSGETQNVIVAEPARAAQLEAAFHKVHSANR